MASPEQTSTSGSHAGESIAGCSQDAPEPLLEGPRQSSKGIAGVRALLELLGYTFAIQTSKPE